MNNQFIGDFILDTDQITGAAWTDGALTIELRTPSGKMDRVSFTGYEPARVLEILEKYRSDVKVKGNQC